MPRQAQQRSQKIQKPKAKSDLAAPAPMGPTKKAAVQKANEEKSSSGRKRNDLILALHRRTEIIRLLDLGYDDASIRAHLGCNDEMLKELKEDILRTLTPAYLSAVDHFRARNYQRYERLYRVAESMATGTSLPDRDLIGWMEDLPQKDWMKIALEILRDQGKLMEADLERAAKRAEEDDDDTNFGDIQTVTMSRKNPLMDTASDAIKSEWGQDPQALLEFIYAPNESEIPMPVEEDPTLLDDLDPSEIHAQLIALNRRLNKVVKDDEPE